MKTSKLISLTLVTLLGFNTLKPLSDSALRGITGATLVAATPAAYFLGNKILPKKDGTRKTEVKRFAIQFASIATALVLPMIVHSLLKKYGASVNLEKLQVSSEDIIKLKDAFKQLQEEKSVLTSKLEQALKSLGEKTTEHANLKIAYEALRVFSEKSYAQLEKMTEDHKLYFSQRILDLEKKLVFIATKGLQGSFDHKDLEPLMIEMKTLLTELNEKNDISEGEIVRQSIKTIFVSAKDVCKKVWYKGLEIISSKENQEYAKERFQATKQSVENYTVAFKDFIETTEKNKPVFESNAEWTQQV